MELFGIIVHKLFNGAGIEVYVSYINLLIGILIVVHVRRDSHRLSKLENRLEAKEQLEELEEKIRTQQRLDELSRGLNRGEHGN